MNGHLKKKRGNAYRMAMLGLQRGYLKSKKKKHTVERENFKKSS